MKMVKSLVWGSAAAILAVGGAQAADLPLKAKAVEYVRVCSLYGSGFYYIPGTDTCVKIGGYLRTDLTVNGGNGGQPFYSGGGAIQERYANMYNDYSRFALTMDTRTATEYGVVRTFGQADFTFGTEGVGNGINLQSSVNTAALNGAAVNNFAGNGGLGVEFAFIQFAGFTFGKSASAFTTPWQGYPGNNTAFLVGGYDTVTGLNNVQYTAQLGNGVSATIGIDDSSANDFNRTQVIHATNGLGGGAGVSAGNFGLYGSPSSNITPLGSAYTGTYVPDVVGNIRVDQAWGLFQVSGALHYVDGSYNLTGNTLGNQFNSFAVQTNAMDSGHPSGKVGGALSAALQIKNLPTGAGDDVKFEGTWAEGASKYTIGTSSALGGSFYMIRNATNGTGGKIAIGAITDAVYGGPTNTGLQMTQSWGFRGAFNHNWDPYWSSSLFGGVVSLDYNNTAKTLWCGTYIAATNNNGGGITKCDPGFTMSEIGLTTRWTPVKNLTFSSEVLYAYLNTKMQGSVSGTQTSSFPTSTGVYQFKNMGTVSLEFRAQRNF
jgi:Porin subfamily